MKVLGLIPARGGSKALPGKNILPLAGKPLIQHTYETAVASNCLDRIILSTDDEAISNTARQFGLEVPFVRPDDCSGDEAPMIDVVIHALNALGREGYRPDAVLVLQPTSPLRKPEHIRTAVERLEDYDAVCSVVPLRKEHNPYYMMKITEDGYLDYLMPEGASITRRQDIPDVYRRDGTIFLARTEVIMEEHNLYGHRCLPYVLDRDEVLVNIDSPKDFEVARQIMEGPSDEHPAG